MREARLTHEVVLLARQLCCHNAIPQIGSWPPLLKSWTTLVTVDDNLLGLGTIRTMKN